MKNQRFSTNQKIAIKSLAMDLKRVALGLHRGSFKMAERFTQEALKRISEIKSTEGSYLYKLLTSIQKILKNQHQGSAEDILMYSTLIQNYAISKLG